MMIDPAFVATMARYNAWQNESLGRAADGLSDIERRQDRGAFFRSIHETLNHVVWADEVWLHRLSGRSKPPVGARDAARYIDDWQALRAHRTQLDHDIRVWAASLDAEWLAGRLVWHSGAAGRQLDRPRGLIVVHMFNHQTHHRGQIHAMLTAAGAKPDDTDLMLIDEPGDLRDRIDDVTQS